MLRAGAKAWCQSPVPSPALAAGVGHAARTQASPHNSGASCWQPHAG